MNVKHCLNVIRTGFLTVFIVQMLRGPRKTADMESVWLRPEPSWNPVAGRYLLNTYHRTESHLPFAFRNNIAISQTRILIK